MRRLAPLLFVALFLAGCGSGGEEGTASLWITRDRGATVLYAGEVEAGQTVMKALRSKADVETRYGGRFVESIDGLEGSLAGGRDWFYFVNGVAADRSAAEYRLRPGEIAWWDYRQWAGEPEVPIVVGAFPEPFLHGYDGEVRPVVVTHATPGQRADARALARLLGGRVARRPPPGANVFRIVEGPIRFVADADSPAGPYRFTFAGDAGALVAEPERFRYRYEVGP